MTSSANPNVSGTKVTTLNNFLLHDLFDTKDDEDCYRSNFDIFNELSLKIRNHYNNYINDEGDPWVWPS
jgi:hypothetical protein